MRLILALVLSLPLAAYAEPWSLREPAAGPEDWGYRPADGTEPAMNPPSFTWAPERNAERWELQVAKGGDFENQVQTWAAPWNAFALPETLEPGTYAWRYRGVDKDDEASAWSIERGFEVSAEAVLFPKPGRDALISRIPKGHPRLMARPEEQMFLAPSAKDPDAAFDDGKRCGSLAITYPGESTPEGMIFTVPSLNGAQAMEEVHTALIAEADALLTKDIDTSEPPLYPEGTDRKGETWKKIWWGNRVHGINASEPAAKLAFVYWLTGDKRFGDRARDIVMDIMAWDPKGSTQYEYNDEAAMPLLYWPTRAYTWAYDCFSEEDRAKVTEVMRVRGEDCYQHLLRGNHLWDPYSSHSNRAWHWLLEVGIVFNDTIPEAPDWVDYAMTIFYTCYPVWGGPDGGWHEGIAYWVSYIDRFQYGAMAIKEAFGIDAYDKPFFKDNGYYGLYTLPPGTKAGAWADQSTTTSSDRIANLMAMMAAGSGNPHWKWYADQHGVDIAKQGWFGFLFAARASGVEAKAPTDLPSSKDFPDTGIAVLNSNLLDGADNVQVHFKSSPYGTQSHGYNANNAFLLNLHGERALIRSGRRDVYGSPHHTQWMWSTKSDNAILVNGEGQYKHTVKAQGRITHFETSPELDVVVGEAGDSYDTLNRWTRRILFFKPDVIVIHDMLEAPEPSSFQWLLHAEAEFAIDGASASVETKGGVVRAEFLYPENLAIAQTGEFETPPHEWASFKLHEWHLTAETTEKAAQQEFITVISVDGAEPGSTVSGDAGDHTLTFQAGGKAHTVRLTPEAYEIGG
ncbi:MAG: DUF4962 domain-containing protein [Candidatus Hydrogenedens sp.]|nr:DUF4962 domain-containing protein [Candidatus Hydrogenedens sp.]